MNDWLVQWGLEAWKPALRVLVMPPVPMLLLALLALGLVRRRPRLGRSLGLLAVLATWLVCTPWAGQGLQALLTQPPPVLAPERIAALRGAPNTAILVLGAGRRALLGEYGGPDLTPLTLERLRYGWWLARQTGLPLGYSGGIGHGARDGPTEADVARLVTARDRGVPLHLAPGTPIHVTMFGKLPPGLQTDERRPALSTARPDPCEGLRERLAPKAG